MEAINNFFTWLFSSRQGVIVLIVGGIRIFFDNEYPDFTWVGTIDYKEKGLHKGFHWK